MEDKYMKLLFKTYAIVWAIGFVLFNIFAIAFASIFAAGTAILGYIFILLAFILQLVVGYKAFQEDNLQKLFYNISIINVTYVSLIAMTIVGIVIMLLPVNLIWLGSFICLAVFGFCAFAILKASAAVEIVEKIDKKIETKTLFIKSLTADAQSLALNAKTDVARAEANKVFEAIRYSDPMSNDALASVESQITLKFNEFSNAIASSDDTTIPTLANELIILITDRNNKCRLLK